MNDKIPIILAKAATLSVALGLMFLFVIDAHEAQKELTTTNNNSTKDESNHSRVFFQSSKIVIKSVVLDSSIGMRIDINSTEDENIGR